MINSGTMLTRLASLARTVEMINYIDSIEHHDASVSQKVEECCIRMEALVTEWKMEAILGDPASPLPLRCLVADHIMNIFAVIIGLKRLANRVANTHTVDTMTVRAARKVVSTLLEFEGATAVPGIGLDPSKTVFAQ
jgi:hypothetical protein